jgi:hypothetical protein
VSEPDLVAVPGEQLEVGRRYVVELDDCCIQGELEGELVDFVHYDEADGGDVCGYRFTFGTLEPATGAFTFRTVDTVRP